MKIVFRILIVLGVLLGIVLVGRNIIAKMAVENGVKAATGLPLSIKKLDLGLRTTHIGINDLSLFSTKEFDNEMMFHAPEIFVDYNFGALIKGKVHLEDIRLNFDRLVIIKNKQGKINLEALKQEGEKEQPIKKEAQKESARDKKAPQMQIDHLAVKIGKVIYKDYSQGASPVIKEYNVNISEELDNVMDPSSLLGFITAKALTKIGLSSLIDFNIDTDAMKQEAEGYLQDTVDSLKDKVKLPF